MFWKVSSVLLVQMEQPLCAGRATAPICTKDANHFPPAFGFPESCVAASGASRAHHRHNNHNTQETFDCFIS